ncbi:MAG: MmcQ/YjbR family DNA-binding protein [Verrucomicrobia bacterium]|nr:MmcQ/YjbR family DNA-binding protein [Verrucomicrobiota bacterium]
MHLDDAIAHCLGQAHVTEETPFGPEVLVYKVAGKLFALTDPGDFPPAINLKCDPARALDLRDQHPAIRPGYHMNKTHWNTVVLDGSLPAALIRELIDHSYDLVVRSLPKKLRADLHAASHRRYSPNNPPPG